jgi:mono/diheme cytochrome c family protein
MKSLALIVALAVTALAATTPSLDQQFTQTVQPVISKYCVGCHSGTNAAAQFDLKSYDSLAPVVRDYPRWELVLARLNANEMPPKQMPQPPAEAKKQVTDWIQAVRAEEIRKHAGDPGPALNRRLSNSEYNYTIRDLTGVDLRPAREFPVDPANQAGFDNTGESLTISPGLMSKYLDAARQTADHLVLKPDGIDFAPFPMLVETDRERYTIQRIVEFYDRQPTDFADYFQAAWRYKHRAALGKPAATLASTAAESKLSARYLNMVWQLLEQDKPQVGPAVKLQAMWRALPAPQTNQPDIARTQCVAMRDFVRKIRRHTEKLFDPPPAPGFNANFQPMVMWRNREIAAHRRDFDPASLRVEGEPPAPEITVTHGPTFGKGEEVIVKKAIADYIKDRAEDPDLVVPAGQRVRYEAAFARFSSVFPTGFYARERGRFYPIDSYDNGRLLGAGFHNVMGYFRDDSTLSDLILDDKGKKELDKLWQDFDFVADYTIRTWQQFLFEGGGGGRGGNPIQKPTFAESTTEATVLRYRDHYIANAAPANNPALNQALKVHFDSINAEIRWVEQARKDAEPRHLDALLKFAARAYRRPLAPEERNDVLAYYHELRDKGNLNHEEAMRASLVSILVSPDFLYRADLVDTSFGGVSSKSTASTRPLSGYALANKLSYFLWSTMPDDELMSHAAAGDLTRPTVLLAQVRRMLKDDRVRGLATEFGGNWLNFRQFETLNSVDRERFPKFNDQLREAMFEEPIHFLTDVIHNDRPVLDMLYGKYTWVNQPLAEHYGMPPVPPNQWVRVDNADAYGRGGILPMAVFLTLNAPGLRTSPVKRGYWVARRVLGEVIPPPPPVVPELPHDEAKSDLPVRDLLAKHRENPVCAGCHSRFDVFGLTFENYGPVGDKREVDMAGRKVDTRANFPGGSEGVGLEGLQTYIRAHREKDFVNNLSQKLLVYGLGRSELISDEPLLDSMRAKMAANGYKFSALVETLVASPQFLNARNPVVSSNKSESKKGE